MRTRSCSRRRRGCTRKQLPAKRYHFVSGSVFHKCVFGFQVGLGLLRVTGHAAPNAMNRTPKIPAVEAHAGENELSAAEINNDKRPNPTNTYCSASI